MCERIPLFVPSLGMDGLENGALEIESSLAQWDRLLASDCF